MADLELQKRKRPIWPWILGALALIALIWLAMEMVGDDDDFADDAVATAPAAADGEPAPGQAAAQAPADVQAFRAECGSASTLRDEMAADHSYEADCLNRLAGALSATVSRDTVGDQPLAERLAVLEQSAEQLTRDAQSTQHASQLRQAMDEATGVFERLAETRPDVGADLREHISELRAAADEFEGTELLLDQKRAAAQYFDHAAAALERMNRNQGEES